MSNRKNIPDLKNLPRHARLRLPHVCAVTGWSPATVWRRVKAGKFPEPSKDGSITSWNNGEVQDHLEARA